MDQPKPDDTREQLIAKLHDLGIGSMFHDQMRIKVETEWAEALLPWVLAYGDQRVTQAINDAADDAAGRWNVKPYVDEWLRAKIASDHTVDPNHACALTCPKCRCCGEHQFTEGCTCTACSCAEISEEV